MNSVVLFCTSDGVVKRRVATFDTLLFLISDCDECVFLCTVVLAFGRYGTVVQKQVRGDMKQLNGANHGAL